MEENNFDRISIGKIEFAKSNFLAHCLTARAFSDREQFFKDSYGESSLDIFISRLHEFRIFKIESLLGLLSRRLLKGF